MNMLISPEALPNRFLFISLLTAVLVFFCISYIDVPLAKAIAISKPTSHHHFPLVRYFLLGTQLSYIVMLPLFVLYYLLRMQSYHGRLMQCASLMATSSVFSFFAKNTLKYAFGRIWPPFSYKVSAAYFNTPRHFNFRFFDANGSFPSGHATMLSCVSLAIILFYRKAAWVLVPFVLLCLAAMLFLNVHYLSDLIAGTYVGCTITLGLYHLQHHLGRYNEAT